MGELLNILKEEKELRPLAHPPPPPPIRALNKLSRFLVFAPRVGTCESHTLHNEQISFSEFTDPFRNNNNDFVVFARTAVIIVCYHTTVPRTQVGRARLA